MAKWLNAVLAGPCTFTVLRDGDVVPVLADVGASLSVANGVVTLETPGDENHEWSVQITPTYLNTRSKFRLRSYDYSVLASAESVALAGGAEVASVSLTLPAATPDPTTFTAYADTAGIAVVELG